MGFKYSQGKVPRTISGNIISMHLRGERIEKVTYKDKLGYPYNHKISPRLSQNNDVF